MLRVFLYYANHLYEVSGTSEIKEGNSYLTLKTSSKNKKIRFTTNGSNPNNSSTIYNSPIKIDKNDYSIRNIEIENKEVSDKRN